MGAPQDTTNHKLINGAVTYAQDSLLQPVCSTNPEEALAFEKLFQGSLNYKVLRNTRLDQYLP